MWCGAHTRQILQNKTGVNIANGLVRNANTQYLSTERKLVAYEGAGVVRCEEHEGKVGKQQQQCQPMLICRPR